MNTTIQTIQNNSNYNLTELTQINADITNIGGQQGINCVAILNISNTSVFYLFSDTYSHSLGTGPNIQLISPLNDSALSFGLNPFDFIYNLTDEFEIINCSLILNGEINKTNFTIQRNVTQNFTQTLPMGFYNWSIQCIDNSSARNIGYSQNYTLNITPNNSPTISNMNLESQIDLTIGGTKIVYCNATITDIDGISEIKSINSTLYHNSVTSTSEDDNNNHYTNNSCKIISSSTYSRNYSCGFPMKYYSDGGNWTCNMTAYDTSDSFDSSKTTTIINDLIALNLSTHLIDFGNLAVGNTSPEDINLTIFNFGNKNINITLKGYGIEDGDGLAMECSKDNISIGYQRYSTSFGDDYSTMTNLTSGYQQIINFTLPQRIDDLSYGADKNSTYWKISIPLGVNGKCNGSITLLAVTT